MDLAADGLLIVGGENLSADGPLNVGGEALRESVPLFQQQQQRRPVGMETFQQPFERLALGRRRGEVGSERQADRDVSQRLRRDLGDLLRIEPVAVELRRIDDAMPGLPPEL
ncbi:hypothetical protein ABS772_09480, partial [Methylorubrum podarium]